MSATARDVSGVAINGVWPNRSIAVDSGCRSAGSTYRSNPPSPVPPTASRAFGYSDTACDGPAPPTSADTPSAARYPAPVSAGGSDSVDAAACVDTKGVDPWIGGDIAVTQGRDLGVRQTGRGEDQDAGVSPREQF